MVESKAWNWENVKDHIWLQACEESYFFAERWRRENKKSILDLGCGLGRHAILFSKYGFKVTAVDLSEYAVNHLKTWQKEESLDISTKLSDMKSLPFMDHAFDCVWAYHVISHTDTNGFQRILDEIKRVLKADGEIFLTLCSKDTWAFKEGDFPKIDDNTVLKTEGDGQVDVPHYFVDLEDILRLFNEFDIINIRHIDNCYSNHQIKNSKHYYLHARIKKDVENLSYTHIIGQEVSGKIDRPLGTYHPKHPNLYYPINYGYVEGIIGGDGSEQDVYYLGESQPVNEFTGKVIAVVHRYNDIEDKWVVAKKGAHFTDEEILSAIHFQEKFFDSKLFT